MGGETTIISQALNALFFWCQFRGHTVTSYKVVIFAVIVFTRMRFFLVSAIKYIQGSRKLLLKHIKSG